MYKPGKILVLLVVVVLIVAAYSVYAKDTVTVSVQGFGDVTGEMTIHFTDGSSTTITKTRAGSLFVQYEGKEVSKLSFDCLVNPKTAYGDKAHLLCDGSDNEHMSKVVVLAGASTMSTIATYPLSLTEKGDYKTVDTGKLTLVWDNIETTRAEMTDTDWGLGNFKVVWQVHLWFNNDVETSEVTGARVDFSLPFQVHKVEPVPVPDDDDQKKNASKDLLDPDPDVPDLFQKGSYDILTAGTEVTRLGTITVTSDVASWRSFSGF